MLADFAGLSEIPGVENRMSDMSEEKKATAEKGRRADAQGKPPGWAKAGGRRVETAAVAWPETGLEGGVKDAIMRFARWRVKSRWLIGALAFLAALECLLGLFLLLGGRAQLPWAWIDSAWVDSALAVNTLVMALLAVGVVLREALWRRAVQRTHRLGMRRLAFLDEIGRRLARDVTQAPGRLDEPAAVAEPVLERLNRLLPLSWAGMWRLEGERLAPIALRLQRPAKAPAAEGPVRLPPALGRLEERAVVCLDPAGMDELAAFGFPKAAHGLACAIRRDGKTAAVLIVGRRGRARAFDQAETAFLAVLAHTVTIALQASHLAHLRNSLAEALTRLDHARQVQAAFLAELSHELRTPLNAVIGFGEMLAQGYATTPDKSRDYANQLLAAARTLLAMIEELLVLSGRESGRGRGEEDGKPANSPAALAVAVAERLGGTAAAHGVRFVSAVNGQAVRPEAQPVAADPQVLRQGVLAAGLWSVTAAGSGGRVEFSLAGTADRPSLVFAITAADPQALDRLLSDTGGDDGPAHKEEGAQSSYVAQGRRLTSPLQFAQSLLATQGVACRLQRRDERRVDFVIMLPTAVAA